MILIGGNGLPLRLVNCILSHNNLVMKHLTPSILGCVMISSLFSGGFLGLYFSANVGLRIPSSTCFSIHTSLISSL